MKNSRRKSASGNQHLTASNTTGDGNPLGGDSFGHEVSVGSDGSDVDSDDEDVLDEYDNIEGLRRSSTLSNMSQWSLTAEHQQYQQQVHNANVGAQQLHLTRDQIMELLSDDYDLNDGEPSHLRTYLEQVYSNIDATRINEISWQTFTAFLIDGIAGVITTVGDGASDPQSKRRAQEKLQAEIRAAGEEKTSASPTNPAARLSNEPGNAVMETLISTQMTMTTWGRRSSVMKQTRSATSSEENSQSSARNWTPKQATNGSRNSGTFQKLNE